MIYGSASEQYARVWDYGKAVIRYNLDSGVYVVVDGVNKPEPPIFMRIYICLAPLRAGFNKRCRPLIGLDECNLKEAYLGQILVAIGKDGNNKIFPFAWATVEVENKETWYWFLESLKKDLVDITNNLGLTFMSDRQKGLLEAFEQLVPLAEKRYCFDFEVAMESIKCLLEDAYEYLENIPTRHWSKHAFSNICKSNMLLNNLCETFNAVIKDARDKPILTQMEWVRKYMMKRNRVKWEAVQKMDGKNMPFDWDSMCVHGFACILDKRVDLDDYVDAYYSRATYILAYEDAIKPIPCPKHWEKIDLRKSLPPQVRVMLGRPKSKKMKLEKGEGAPNSKETQPKLHKF
ncbi:uncharacterized protein LOC110686481 [Chenopodium quinoa]|uniref:uncharacterized protein LOC110686481 n=1 Tax=Chenopodium quinoa TaxID=63459 RepID=UPI000B777FAA|nr:uncharacterized protein LOC110686481 [Chenopodium quinoa]